MDNECTIDPQSEGSYLWSNSIIRKATKPHKCCECNEDINIGDRYEFVAGKNDDPMSDGNGWNFHHTCMTCCRIWSIISPFCTMHEGLDDHLMECRGERLADVKAELNNPTASREALIKTERKQDGKSN